MGARYFTEMLERVPIRAADRLVKQLFNVLFGCDAPQVAQELVKVTHQNPRGAPVSPRKRRIRGEGDVEVAGRRRRGKREIKEALLVFAFLPN